MEIVCIIVVENSMEIQFSCILIAISILWIWYGNSNVNRNVKEKLHGNPPPDVTWYKGNEQNGEHKGVTRKEEEILRFPDVNREV
jgi:hypothetical protein